MYSDEQLREAARVTPMKIATSIFGLLALKWIILIGLNRWSRSIK